MMTAVEAAVAEVSVWDAFIEEVVRLEECDVDGLSVVLEEFGFGVLVSADWFDTVLKNMRLGG